MLRAMRSKAGKRKKHRYAKDAHSAYTYTIPHAGIIPKNHKKILLESYCSGSMRTSENSTEPVAFQR